jgi:uncharacterized protein
MINTIESNFRGFAFMKRGIMASGVVIMGLVGCSTTPTPNYYSLTPQVGASSTSSVRVIEVLPVGLPDRLDRPLIVLQQLNGQAKVLDNERWTSPLSAELRDGLSAGLQQKLGAVDRYSSGMTGGKDAYRIATDFSRFDIIEKPTSSGPINQEIAVAVAWTIKLEKANRVLDASSKSQAVSLNQLSCRMQFSTPVVSTGQKMTDIVNTAQQSLSQVVNAVSASVVNLETKKVNNLPNVVCA